MLLGRRLHHPLPVAEVAPHRRGPPGSGWPISASLVAYGLPSCTAVVGWSRGCCRMGWHDEIGELYLPTTTPLPHSNYPCNLGRHSESGTGVGKSSESVQCAMLKAVTHAQTWASYSALYRFGRLSRGYPPYHNWGVVPPYYNFINQHLSPMQLINAHSNTANLTKGWTCSAMPTRLTDAYDNDCRHVYTYV